ncbi:MAG: hypothetical protein EA397_12675 [Deltaproteobacteria bacterium]|nr:MAG: hypothetical protein EA397_12675 [Deltaproteobacteria bacterium]
MADEDYAYGSGNGGRSCTGVSCLTIIIAVLLLAFLYIVPIATQNMITEEQLFYPWTVACGWACCCFGSIGLIVGIVLTFIDDPEKAAEKERKKKLAKARAKAGK